MSFFNRLRGELESKDGDDGDFPVQTEIKNLSPEDEEADIRGKSLKALAELMEVWYQRKISFKEIQPQKNLESEALDILAGLKGVKLNKMDLENALFLARPKVAKINKAYADECVEYFGKLLGVFQERHNGLSGKVKDKPDGDSN